MSTRRVLGTIAMAVCAATTLTLSQAVPASAEVSFKCSYGALAGIGQTSLSNGTLQAAACSYSTDNVAQINIAYRKTAGSTVKLRFFWE